MSNNAVLNLPLSVNGVIVGTANVDGSYTIDETSPIAEELKRALTGPYVSVEELSIEDFAEALAIDPKGKHAASEYRGHGTDELCR